MGLGVPAAPQLLAPTLKAPTSPPPQLRQLLTDPQGEEKEDWKETQTRQVGWIRLLQALCSRGWGQRGCLVAAGRAGDHGEAPGALGLGWVGSMGRAGCWMAFQGGRQFSETRAVTSWWPGCPLQRPNLVVAASSQPPAPVPIPAVPWGCPAFAPRHGSMCLCLLSVPRSESGSRKKRRHR